jgi:hypothetical protein
MKITWKGNWKKGEVVIETEDLDELVRILDKLENIEAPVPASKSIGTSQTNSVETPKISGASGPSQAIREILGSSWGRATPRTMKEISAVLQANAIYFSPSSLSGVLTNMTKKGELKRPSKKEGQWAYVLSS